MLVFELPPSIIILDPGQTASQYAGSFAIVRFRQRDQDTVIVKGVIPAYMVFNGETSGILKGIRRISVRTLPAPSAIMKYAV